MNRWIVLPLVALALARTAFAADPPPPPALSAEALVTQARDELRNLDLLVDTSDKPAIKAEIHRRAARADLLLSQAQAALTGQRVQAAALAEATPLPQEPMVAQDFRSLLAEIDRTSFSASKLGIIQSAASTNYFTAAQVKQIVEMISFGKDKVEAGKILFPRVVDPGNWFHVYEALDFDSDKDALRKAVGK